MAFNEDSRVKIPAILHLIRLGYTYIWLLPILMNGRVSVRDVEKQLSSDNFREVAESGSHYKTK
jgi:hypothetical protein